LKEKIMQIAPMKIISLVNNRIVGDAFATALPPEKLTDKAYEVTQADIDAVAVVIENRRQSVLPIGAVDEVFGEMQTNDAWLARVKEFDSAEYALRAVIKALGLDTPALWIAMQG
jgi:hypothetical protein